MRVAIVGRSEMLYKTATMLYENKFDIPIIITATEAPEYTKTKQDFKDLANQIGALYVCSSNLNRQEVLSKLKEAQPLSIGVSVNFPGVIGSNIIEKFENGILNAHGGDLPKYRGNACQAWAILNGESEVGLCIHKMVPDELDSGDIIERSYFPLTINTRIGQVQSWMASKIPILMLSSVEKIKNNPSYILKDSSRIKEDSFRCYPLKPKDAKIEWGTKNFEIIRLVNASSEPYSGAYCFWGEEKIKIWRAEIINDNENFLAIPGQICSICKTSGAVSVATGKGKVLLREVEKGGKRQKPSAFISSIRERLE